MGLESGNGRGGQEVSSFQIEEKTRQLIEDFGELVGKTGDWIDQLNALKLKPNQEELRDAFLAVKGAYMDASIALTRLVENVADSERVNTAQQSMANLKSTIMQYEKDLPPHEER